MRTGMFAISAGLVWVGLWPSLLPWQPFLLLAVLLLLPALMLSDKRGMVARLLLFVGLMLSGVTWHLFQGGQKLDNRLPPELEGRDLLVRGYVATLPETRPTGQRFQFVVESAEAIASGSKLLLNSYGLEPVRAAEYWQLLVRLKQPHGSSNPGAFDYEAWLFQQGIGAAGYVRTSADNRRLPQTRRSLLALRSALRERLVETTAELPFQAVLLAMTLGDRQWLTDRQWEVFSRTGTNHLVVISGLHVVLVATLCAWLWSTVWRCSVRLMSLLPAQHAGALAAIGGALAYSSLAGFALPAQRAVVMVVVFVSTRLLSVQGNSWFALQLALLVVLVLDPLAATGAGLWLSFSAVAALLLVNRRRQFMADNNSRRLSVTALVVPQLAVFTGLLVPLGFWQGQVSLLAPLANLLAIPVVSWLVVPLCLLGCGVLAVSPAGARGLFALASQIFGWLYQLLEYLGDLPGIEAGWQLNPVSFVLMLLAGLGTVLLLLPGFAGSRFLGMLLLLPMLWPATPKSSANRLLEIHVLDVGQGLAVIVSTASHTLVYDSGPRFSSGFDSGAAIVAPVLRWLGVRRIDLLVVSHADNDHGGGAPALLEAMPAAGILSGEPLDLPSHPVVPCRANQAWHWDGVDFRILHPAAAGYHGNNSSCVLMVSVGTFQLLLPGDIEAEVERGLLGSLAIDGPLEVFLSAHHGSNTSSSYSFVATLDPQLVIHSAGYRNQFGHPTDTIRRRFAQSGARQLNTASSGMISVSLERAGKAVEVRRHREVFQRYWHWQADRDIEQQDRDSPVP